MSEPLVITPEQAEGLLVDGAEYIHNFAGGGMVLIGCDYERAHALTAFKAAHRIEIGGPGCKAMKHPIVVWDAPGHYTFFEADMKKVEELERSK